MRYLLLLFLFQFHVPLFSQSATGPYTPDWTSLDQRPTPDWWQEAKFGIFIHWGVYSVPAFTPKGCYAEWYQNSLLENDPDGAIKAFHQANFGERDYYDLANDFHAELFNPDAWASLFEKSGAKYVVLTSKHHDGFCLWPSAQASRTWGRPWNAATIGPKRDLLGDLFAALRKTSVKPGLYFSLYEWYNPLWKFDHARYAADHAMPQLYDVVQRYEPWVVWSDGDWDTTPETWQSPKFLAWLYNESAVRDRVVVNDRWGNGTRFKHGGIYTPEYQPDLDFDNHDWEESRGMGASYGYNRNEDAWDYNSAQSLVLHLVDKVSRGGNFLLDIGPDAHGQIPPIMQERLLEIGAWLKINGEAIYGTQRWRNESQWTATGKPDYKPAKGEDPLLKITADPAPGYASKEAFFTWSPQTKSLYAILPRYPADKRLTLRGISLPAGTEVTLLETKEKLKWEAGQNGQTTISLPEYYPDKFKSTHAFVLKIARFGEFVAAPAVKVAYDPKTLQPTVSMSTTTPGASIRYSIDGSEPTASSPAYERPFAPARETTIQARAFKNGLLASKETDVEVRFYNERPAVSLYAPPQPGLNMQLMQPVEYTSSSLQRAPVERAEVVKEVTADPSCLTGKCAQVWKGYFQAERSGGYQFWTESDDGSVLYLDGEIVVDNDGDHGMEEKMGMVNLQKGWHVLRLVYFNSGGGAGLRVSFAPMGEERKALKEAALGH